MPSAFPSPLDLLPHRPPMLLLRAVVSHAPEETCCTGMFDRAFAEACGGEITAAFGLELIAQAAAVHHGLRQRLEGQTHAAAVRGLLLGSRRLDLRSRWLPINETLRVTVFDGGRAPVPGGLIRFEGRVENASGQLLASGDATVLEWRPDVQLA